MDLALQIQNVVRELDDTEKSLILEVAKRFLPDYIATDEDLRDISIAHEEYARGETISHNDIDWS
ncbi:MAG: hypothetical protein FWG87_07170 [Defluviitaleaceae bacterium]|nr:hypothetical protein [Defluviitaleaceae bacterium]